MTKHDVTTAISTLHKDNTRNTKYWFSGKPIEFLLPITPSTFVNDQENSGPVMAPPRRRPIAESVIPKPFAIPVRSERFELLISMCIETRARNEEARHEITCTYMMKIVLLVDKPKP